jgi:hypothetical protein
MVRKVRAKTLPVRPTAGGFIFEKDSFHPGGLTGWRGKVLGESALSGEPVFVDKYS